MIWYDADVVNPKSDGRYLTWDGRDLEIFWFIEDDWYHDSNTTSPRVEITHFAFMTVPA